jgi:hypothetical protein
MGDMGAASLLSRSRLYDRQGVTAGIFASLNQPIDRLSGAALRRRRWRGAAATASGAVRWVRWHRASVH